MGIKVTDEMKDAVRAFVINEFGGAYLAFTYDAESLVKRIIELHEQSKPKPEPVAWCRIDNGKVVAVDWDGVNDNCPTQLYTTTPTREPYTGERIICAAIKHSKFGMFCGYRHANCINHAGKYYTSTSDDQYWQQGFITTDNGRFVDRAEAWIIADKAGQIINRGEGIDGLLFSENLY